jgi:protein-S-isoprenylcysteine O-methyltransferase
MLKRFILGIFASFIIVILPTVGNPAILTYPQLWIVVGVGFLGSILQPVYKMTVDLKNNYDRGSEAQIIWSVYISQLAVICEATYYRYPASIEWNLLTSIALCVIIIGLLIRTWSVQTLGKYFTMHLAVQQNQQVIKSGPYKYVRHPSYLGAFLMYVGIPIFLHAWFSLFFTVIILSIAWGRRICYEEKMLIDTFGEEYESYCHSVKRVIPGIW